MVQRNDQAHVQAVEVKKATEQPPLLYDLTGLQKEANKKLGLSASETLKIAQSLYEKRFITYPRTGSKYIPEDIWSEIPNLVRALADKQSIKPAGDKIKWSQFNKRIVNDLKVTDHHGLLITEKIPSALNVKENLIYDMIALRLLESLSQACIKEVCKVTIQVTHYDFTAKGNKILEPGWRAIQGDFGDDKPETAQKLPELEKGMELKVKEAKILEKKTKPPSLYTEASLLAAMENAGREIENEQARKALQNIGIGTPATRAAIIETLFFRNYIERKKKVLLPTKKGLQVFELVKDLKIANVSMTAEWELALQKIENGQADAIDFQKKIEKYVESITAELLKTSFIGEDLPKLPCPKCKSQNLIIYEKIVKCSDEKCDWKQFRNICGVQIGIADIERLITQGKTSLIKGMKSRSGKKFNAYLVLNNQAESSFEFEKRKKRNGK